MSPWRGFSLNTGPNAGFSCVGGDEFFLRYDTVRVVYNELLRRADDPLYRAPERRGCTASRLLAEIRGHEFTHVRFLSEGLAAGELAKRWEANVFYGSREEAAAHYQQWSKELSDELLDYGDDQHNRSQDYPPQTPECYAGLLRNPQRPRP